MGKLRLLNYVLKNTSANSLIHNYYSKLLSRKSEPFFHSFLKKYTDVQLCLVRSLSSVYVLTANLNYEMVKIVKSSNLVPPQSMKREKLFPNLLDALGIVLCSSCEKTDYACTDIHIYVFRQRSIYIHTFTHSHALRKQAVNWHTHPNTPSNLTVPP